MSKNLKEIMQEMTPEEVTTLKKKLSDKPAPYEGTTVTFFFPNDMYESQNVVMAQPPRKGEFVYIRCYFPEHPDRDFTEQYKWRVDRVDWSLTVQGKTKDRLILNNTIHAEVHLVPED